MARIDRIAPSSPGKIDTVTVHIIPLLDSRVLSLAYLPGPAGTIRFRLCEGATRYVQWRENNQRVR